jgi:hypothetical protein
MDLAQAKSNARTRGTRETRDARKVIRTAVLTFGALVILTIVTIWVVNSQVSGGIAGSPAETAGTELVIGVIPVDLTQGGTRRITLHILDDGGCVDTYNAQMAFLVEDCKGEFHDLRGLGPAYYASSRSDHVRVRINTW